MNFCWDHSIAGCGSDINRAGCCPSPSSLAAGVPGDLRVPSLCPVDNLPRRTLVPGSWKPALSSFKASVSPLLPPPSSSPPLKKGGYPCVEYTACNFAVKPQLEGQCCDWLCKDLSLKGNYTKFPSEGQLSLDRIQEKPHIIPLFIEMLGSL